MMRWLIVMAGLCLAQPALAASAPPTTVMLGTARSSDTNGGNDHFCSMLGGAAGFQRAAVTAGRPNPPAISQTPLMNTNARGRGNIGGTIRTNTSGRTKWNVPVPTNAIAVKTRKAICNLFVMNFVRKTLCQPRRRC